MPGKRDAKMNGRLEGGRFLSLRVKGFRLHLTHVATPIEG